MGEKIDGLEKEIESLKKEKVESEKRVRELEREIGVLEVKETEEKSKRIRIEKEMRERLEEKDGEVSLLKKKIEELESVVWKNGAKLLKWMREKRNVELALRELQEKCKAVELKMGQLQKEVTETGRVMSESKKKTVGAMNETVKEVKEILEGGNEKGSSRLSLPLVAGSTGAVIVVVVVVFVL